jgi:hypothetical protein
VAGERPTIRVALSLILNTTVREWAKSGIIGQPERRANRLALLHGVLGGTPGVVVYRQWQTQVDTGLFARDAAGNIIAPANAIDDPARGGQSSAYTLYAEGHPVLTGLAAHPTVVGIGVCVYVAAMCLYSVAVRGWRHAIEWRSANVIRTDAAHAVGPHDARLSIRALRAGATSAVNVGFHSIFLAVHTTGRGACAVGADHA